MATYYIKEHKSKSGGSHCSILKSFCFGLFNKKAAHTNNLGEALELVFNQQDCKNIYII